MYNTYLFVIFDRIYLRLIIALGPLSCRPGSQPMRGPGMSYESLPVKPRAGHKYTIANYISKDYMARNKIHIILISLCALLLLGDFLTTSMALSLAETNNEDMTVSEGNPLMAQVASTPIAFLFVKMMILQVVVASAYVLRKEGAVAYLPCILVCAFYIWVNMNNINILAAALI
jgi:hypothetical protein